MSSGLTSSSHLSPTENKLKQLPAGVGAGHVGTDVWNEKWDRYQKMKEFGRLNEKINKMMYQNKSQTKKTLNTSSTRELSHDKSLPLINDSSLSRLSEIKSSIE